VKNMKDANKVKVSDVLWEAANKCLFDGEVGVSVYSCAAIAVCAHILKTPPHNTIWFLHNLGVVAYSMSEFNEFEAGEQRQGARYLWLMFAYLVALDEEEQGLL
jgi:hypothetical protein